MYITVHYSNGEVCKITQKSSHAPCVHVIRYSYMYILYTRSHNSPKIEHDLQRITTIGYKYIAQHQKKKTKKTQDVIIFIFKLDILNQQKIVHVLLCVEKNGTIIIFLFGFLLSVVICCTICSIISQRYTPLFSAKKNI